MAYVLLDLDILQVMHKRVIDLCETSLLKGVFMYGLGEEKIL